jgi:hypothetical protein
MNDLGQKLLTKIISQYSQAGAGGTDSANEIGKINDILKKGDVKERTFKKKKGENKESTGSGSAGGFEAPLFSEPKKMDSMFKDEQPKKKIKGGFVYETEEMEEKWSEKYKKSIDCNNPKGFSQRAHCQGKKKRLKEDLTEAERTSMAKLRDLAKKYACKTSKNCSDKEKIEDVYEDLKQQYNTGLKIEKNHKSGNIRQIVINHLSEDPEYYTKLKKVEAKEMTGSGSSGSFEGPAFGAKSMSPKDWGPKRKTQIPGGQFVEVKKKCKTFPYCNQGIDALNLTESEVFKNTTKKIAEQYNVDVKLIQEIIMREIRKNKRK